MNNELLTMNISKAMIFSAGLGTRFKPWTDKHPKALALVNGKSLLQRNIEYLQQYNIRDVVVNVHHFADQIVDAVKRNKGWGSNVVISDETNEVLETGGGLLKAKSLLIGNEPFITLNVDILTNLNIGKLLAFHREHKPLISFGVTNRKTSRYFLFDENNRLCGWRNINTGEFLIYNGEAHVVSDNDKKVTLHDGAFIGEISFNSGKLATADIYCQPMNRMVYWDQKELKEFLKRNPNTKEHFNTIINQDLTKKLLG